jgi:hypothetical protein
MIPLAVFEEIIGTSGVAARIEAMLPTGMRPRQLTGRALLAGMCPEPLTRGAPSRRHHPNANDKPQQHARNQPGHTERGTASF